MQGSQPYCATPGGGTSLARPEALGCALLSVELDVELAVELAVDAADELAVELAVDVTLVPLGVCLRMQAFKAGTNRPRAEEKLAMAVVDVPVRIMTGPPCSTVAIASAS